MKIGKNLAVCLALLTGVMMMNNTGEAAENYAHVKAYIPDYNYTPDLSRGADNFYKSKQLIRRNVTFKNLYDMKIAGHLFLPKTMAAGDKLPAIIVGHPMGAVKEQSADLYAQKMAEYGYATLSVDLSYWGESEGSPRNSVNPDMYAETFSAAADYLTACDFVDENKIGAIGICAGGGFVISAAKIDSRLKAVATVSMVDMGSATRFGALRERQNLVVEASNERTAEYQGAETKYTGGTVNELTADTDPMQREFYDFYRSLRGAYGMDWTTTHPTLASNVKFMNFYPFADMEMISPRPLLFIAGEQAVSKIFSEDAYGKAAEPKEIYYVKDAGHVDLYDRTELIPFEKLAMFFGEHLKRH